MRRVMIFFLAIFVVLGGCARKPDVTYVELPPEAPPVSAPGAITLAAAEFDQRSRSGPNSEPDSWNTRVAPDPVQETYPQFDLIRAKAERVGVEHLTQADIEGLSFNQIQELRGY